MTGGIVFSRRSALLGAGAFGVVSCAAPPRGPSFPSTEGLLRRYVAEGKIAGACVAIGRLGEEPVFVSAGKRALSEAEPAGPDTLWRIYSMTKPITALAALAMIEDGQMRLDQPLADFAPAFAAVNVAVNLEPLEVRPALRPITIRHLMTHTAGFSYHINGDGPLQRLYRTHGIFPQGAQIQLQAGDAPPPATLQEFGERLAALPLAFDPGARWEYSIGLDVLGLAIENAAGMPFEAYLRRRLLDPLGMTDTAFSVSPAQRARLSGNYQVTPEALREIDAPAQSVWVDAHVLPAGGAGLVSSARDYAKFCAMLLNDGMAGGRRVIAAETARRAHSDLLPPALRAFPDWWRGEQFGAAMSIETARSARLHQQPPGAYGWSGAAGTRMWVDPGNRVYVAAMTQFMPSEAYPFREDLELAVYADLA